MHTQTKAVVGGVSLIAFLAGSIVTALVLTVLQPLDAIAIPTQLCQTEIKVVAAVFLVSVVVMRPAKDALERRLPSPSSFLWTKVGLPRPIQAVALAVVIMGSFVFAFWSTADVLGGYNGYDYSFAAHPLLPLVYDHTIALLPYVGSLDKGTQASLFLVLAMLGVVVLRLNRGVGRALEDSVTLFAAPCLVIFELALWHYATEDMSWHVTDFLVMGGAADGGYRAFDNGGSYIFSNWLVLAVALFLVASRIPWLSVPSRFIWRRKGAADH